MTITPEFLLVTPHNKKAALGWGTEMKKGSETMRAELEMLKDVTAAEMHNSVDFPVQLLEHGQVEFDLNFKIVVDDNVARPPALVHKLFKCPLALEKLCTVQYCADRNSAYH